MKFTAPVVLLDPGNFSPQYTANLCAALAELDADVTLITSAPQFGQTPSPRGYRMEECFFRYFNSPSAMRRSVARNARARMLLKACAYPFGLARVKRLLSMQAAPGILHYQWAHLPALDVRLVSALRARGWRVVATAHDPISQPPFASLHQRQAVRFYQSVDAVVVHTQRLAEQARAALAIPPARLNVIARGGLGILNGPPLDREQARARIGLSGAGPVLLFFGMIKPNKGLEHLLHALPEIRRFCPDVRLVIAGEPVEKFDRYAAIIRELDIGSAVVTRLGYVSDEEVGAYVQAADLVTLPHTRISVSGVAWVALSLGRPIVGTDVGGLADLVEDGVNGFLVPPGSADALSATIIQALRDPERLARMGARGRERFEADHSWNRTALETLGLYASLMPARASE